MPAIAFTVSTLKKNRNPYVNSGFPTARNCCDIFSKGAVLSAAAITQRSPNRYTLRRNVARPLNVLTVEEALAIARLPPNTSVNAIFVTDGLFGLPIPAIVGIVGGAMSFIGLAASVFRFFKSPTRPMKVQPMNGNIQRTGPYFQH